MIEMSWAYETHIKHESTVARAQRHRARRKAKEHQLKNCIVSFGGAVVVAQLFYYHCNGWTKTLETARACHRTSWIDSSSEKDRMAEGNRCVYCACIAIINVDIIWWHQKLRASQLFSMNCGIFPHLSLARSFVLGLHWHCFRYEMCKSLCASVCVHL